MSNRTRSIVKGIAVLLVLLVVMMHMGWIAIPALVGYKIWIVIIAFAIVLISSR